MEWREPRTAGLPAKNLCNGRDSTSRKLPVSTRGDRAGESTDPQQPESIRRQAAAHRSEDQKDSGLGSTAALRVHVGRVELGGKGHCSPEEARANRLRRSGAYPKVASGRHHCVRERRCFGHAILKEGRLREHAISVAAWRSSTHECPPRPRATQTSM